MRFSNQVRNQTGPLTEEERRIVCSRAILGEWLGGSGGGWQDSGGLWPGIKVIKGRTAKRGDPEFSISRGCLLPDHKLLSGKYITKEIEHRIMNSIVLIHGGISLDVGPILEMVTRKYLLKYEKEWNSRLMGIDLFDKIVDSLKTGDMKEVGRLTTLDWDEAIQGVIPWVNNAFTERLITRAREEFRENFWGFLMLGGTSGGGMAFIINPDIREVFKKRILAIMLELKDIYMYSFPFIIDPTVYDFELNNDGTVARLLKGPDALIPNIPPRLTGKESVHTEHAEEDSEDIIKKRYGFDSDSHEHMKAMLKTGEIGLHKNRLPSTSIIEDVKDNEIHHSEKETSDPALFKTGMDALGRNEIAVVTFAGGMGSRWTHGAAVVKAINPFIKIDGRFRTFMEIHLAKSSLTGNISGHAPPHVFTTSYLTHDAIAGYLNRFDNFDYKGNIYLSPSKSIAHRVYPMERDLMFSGLSQKQDENVQKVKDDIYRSLAEWAKQMGEGDDYSDNRPLLRFNPPGHWYEIPNLLKNGILARMIRDNPNLKYLLCHNIDTTGSSADPALLGIHIKNRSCITFEVTPRRIEDRGGGLAKVNNHVQLVEGLALPAHEDEFKLSYFNTLTNWITIDALLEYFGLSRDLIVDAEDRPDLRGKIIDSIRGIEKKMPTYVTIKNVKYLWGSGQEDVHPVAQFEKLWGDMSGLKDIKIGYASVPRDRGQQLKEPSQLDRWVMDGSFEHVRSICDFNSK
jgi:hypothetical protein